MLKDQIETLKVCPNHFLCTPLWVQPPHRGAVHFKEVQIVYRLFLVNCCMETYREKQKPIETEVFIIYVGGLVIQ